VIPHTFKKPPGNSGGFKFKNITVFTSMTYQRDRAMQFIVGFINTHCAQDIIIGSIAGHFTPDVLPSHPLDISDHSQIFVPHRVYIMQMNEVML